MYRDTKNRSKALQIPILRYGKIVRARPTGFHPKAYSKHYAFEFAKVVSRKERLGMLSRIGLLVLPSLSIPFVELSLSALLDFPIIIPSPIGMEICDVCTTILYTSFRPRLKWIGLVDGGKRNTSNPLNRVFKRDAAKLSQSMLPSSIVTLWPVKVDSCMPFRTYNNAALGSLASWVLLQPHEHFRTKTLLVWLVSSLPKLLAQVPSSKHQEPSDVEIIEER